LPADEALRRGRVYSWLVFDEVVFWKLALRLSAQAWFKNLGIAIKLDADRIVASKDGTISVVAKDGPVPVFRLSGENFQWLLQDPAAATQVIDALSIGATKIQSVAARGARLSLGAKPIAFASSWRTGLYGLQECKYMYRALASGRADLRHYWRFEASVRALSRKDKEVFVAYGRGLAKNGFKGPEALALSDHYPYRAVYELSEILGPLDEAVERMQAQPDPDLAVLRHRMLDVAARHGIIAFGTAAASTVRPKGLFDDLDSALSGHWALLDAMIEDGIRVQGGVGRLGTRSDMDGVNASGPNYVIFKRGVMSDPAPFSGYGETPVSHQKTIAGEMHAIYLVPRPVTGEFLWRGVREAVRSRLRNAHGRSVSRIIKDVTDKIMTYQQFVDCQADLEQILRGTLTPAQAIARGSRMSSREERLVNAYASPQSSHQLPEAFLRFQRQLRWTYPLFISSVLLITAALVGVGVNVVLIATPLYKGSLNAASWHEIKPALLYSALGWFGASGLGALHSSLWIWIFERHARRISMILGGINSNAADNQGLRIQESIRIDGALFDALEKLENSSNQTWYQYILDLLANCLISSAATLYRARSQAKNVFLEAVLFLESGQTEPQSLISGRTESPGERAKTEGARMSDSGSQTARSRQTAVVKLERELSRIRWMLVASATIASTILAGFVIAGLPVTLTFREGGIIQLSQQWNAAITIAAYCAWLAAGMLGTFYDFWWESIFERHLEAVGQLLYKGFRETDLALRERVRGSLDRVIALQNDFQIVRRAAWTTVAWTTFRDIVFVWPSYRWGFRNAAMKTFIEAAQLTEQFSNAPQTLATGRFGPLAETISPLGDTTAGPGAGARLADRVFDYPSGQTKVHLRNVDQNQTINPYVVLTKIAEKLK
ncbi:MAG: hypothetical protein WCG06_03140, partial [Candidatus Omnitrophota bacterium]